MDVQSVATECVNKRISVLFRADASLAIGTGHIMRCLTLADGLARQGIASHFLSRDHLGHLLDVVKTRGYGVTVLPPGPKADLDEGALAHSDWLGTDWFSDAQESLKAIHDMHPAWVVVDHYALDARWERVIRQGCPNVMAIDDLADRPHDCDILLDQNLGRSEPDYADRVPPQCDVLTGPKYALLRPEFAQMRITSLERRKVPQLKNLLITLGGVDQSNVTGLVLQKLAQVSGLENCRATVVMGPQAPWLAQIQAQALRMPFPTEVGVGVNDMADRMTQADLCIGAAGSTSWERCCLGLPTVLLILAANQSEIARHLDLAGAVVVAQPYELLDRLNALLIAEGREARLASLSRYAANVTTGDGVHHVIAALRKREFS